MARRIILLGPQQHQPTVMDAIRDLGVEGPVATVTAGWEERESEDADLRDHLQGRGANLGLWPRAEEVFRSDPEVRATLFERYDRLRALQRLYRMRLAGQLETCRKLLAQADPAHPDDLYGPEIDDAVEDVRALDVHHLGRVAALDAEICERIAASERPSLMPHRQQLAERLRGCGAILIAGGHVGILLNRLRLFELLSQAPVLAHPRKEGQFILDTPHANHRLRLDDAARVALFARRFAPDVCAALDGGERLTGFAGQAEWAVTGTRVLTTDGGVRGEDAA